MQHVAAAERGTRTRATPMRSAAKRAIARTFEIAQQTLAEQAAERLEAAMNAVRAEVRAAASAAFAAMTGSSDTDTDTDTDTTDNDERRRASSDDENDEFFPPGTAAGAGGSSGHCLARAKKKVACADAFCDEPAVRSVPTCKLADGRPMCQAHLEQALLAFCGQTGPLLVDGVCLFDGKASCARWSLPVLLRKLGKAGVGPAALDAAKAAAAAQRRRPFMAKHPTAVLVACRTCGLEDAVVPHGVPLFVCPACHWVAQPCGACGQGLLVEDLARAARVDLATARQLVGQWTVAKSSSGARWRSPLLRAGNSDMRVLKRTAHAHCVPQCASLVHWLREVGSTSPPLRPVRDVVTPPVRIQLWGCRVLEYSPSELAFVAWVRPILAKALVLNSPMFREMASMAHGKCMVMRDLPEMVQCGGGGGGSSGGGSSGGDGDGDGAAPLPAERLFPDQAGALDRLTYYVYDYSSLGGVLDALFDEGQTQTCPSCGQRGYKDEHCLEMACCKGVGWCYLCRSTELPARHLTCPKMLEGGHMPLYGTAQGLEAPVCALHPARAVELLHVTKTALLARKFFDVIGDVAGMRCLRTHARWCEWWYEHACDVYATTAPYAQWLVHTAASTTAIVYQFGSPLPNLRNIDLLHNMARFLEQ